jgi:hypothetical protein
MSHPCTVVESRIIVAAPPSDFAQLEIPLARSALTLGGPDAPVFSDLSPRVLPMAELLETLRDLGARGVRRVLWKVESVGGCTTSALLFHNELARFCAEGRRVVIYVPPPWSEPAPGHLYETACGGFLGSAATMWPLAATVVLHPQAYMLLHGPVFEPNPEFAQPWRERLVCFYEGATAGLIPRGILEAWMALDDPAHCVFQPAPLAVRHGLADFVGDEDFARRLALGEIDPRPSPRASRRPPSGLLAPLPAGRPQGIVNHAAQNYALHGKVEHLPGQTACVVSGPNMVSASLSGGVGGTVTVHLAPPVVGTPMPQTTQLAVAPPSPYLWDGHVFQPISWNADGSIIDFKAFYSDLGVGGDLMASHWAFSLHVVYV